MALLLTLQPVVTAPVFAQGNDDDASKNEQEVIPAKVESDDTPTEPGAPEPGENTPAGRSEIIRETTAPVIDATKPATPELTQPPTAPDTAPPATTPVERAIRTGPVTIDPAAALESLISQGIFTAEMATRETVSRAELATILIKALDYKTDLISQFPFYRDVSADYWAYRPIELARQEKLIRIEENGFYHPDQPIRYMEAYQAIANALSSPTPSEESADMLLAPYPDQGDISYEARPVLAKLVNSRFFPVRRQQPAPPLRPEDPATPLGLAPLVSHLLDVTHLRAGNRPSASSVQGLPAGLRLVITPTSAIFQSRLGVGDNVNFSLVEAVGPLPKGSRLRGRVTGTTGEDGLTVDLMFVRTPEDAFYRMSAGLTLTFSRKDKEAFVVPGDIFETVSQEPPAGNGFAWRPGAITPSSPAERPEANTIIQPSGEETTPSGEPLSPKEQEKPNEEKQ